MNDIDISGLPGKIQPPHTEKSAAKNETGETFQSFLANSLKEVNSAQINANKAVENLVAGKTENIHETMIQMQKASISFQMMMEVRNKLVDAYKEIIKMRG